MLIHPWRLTVKESVSKALAAHIKEWVQGEQRSQAFFRVLT